MKGPPVPADHKWCRACFGVFPLQEFHVDRSNPHDGRQCYCKPCQLQRVYDSLDPAKRREYSKKYYVENREALLEQQRGRARAKRRRAVMSAEEIERANAPRRNAQMTAAQIERRRQTQHKHYVTHAAQIRDYQRQYYHTHHERVLETARACYHRRQARMRQERADEAAASLDTEKPQTPS